MSGSIFDQMPAADADTVRAQGVLVHVPEGWSPISQGTGADKAYIIVSGEVSVRRGGEEVAVLGPGEIIGETSIVEHHLRNATIVSISDLELLHYTDAKLQALLTNVPSFKAAVDAVIAERQA